MSTQREEILSLLDSKYYSLKRIFDKYKKLSMIQVLNRRGQIFKCLFYDDNGRLSNVCVYNTDTGKELKNVTYRSDGKTISSIREFYETSGLLSSVSFFKENGKNLSSKIEYNESGTESQFYLYCDDGEVITQCI